MAISNQQIFIGGYIYNVKATLVDHNGTSKDVNVDDTVKQKIQQLAQELAAQTQNTPKPLSSYKVIHINNDGVQLGDDQRKQFSSLSGIQAVWNEAVAVIQAAHKVDTEQRQVSRPLDATATTVDFTFGAPENDADALELTERATPSAAPSLYTPTDDLIGRYVTEYRPLEGSATIKDEIDNCWNRAKDLLTAPNDYESRITLFMLFANKYASGKTEAQQRDIRNGVLDKLHALLGEFEKAAKRKESYLTRAYRWYTGSKSNLRTNLSTAISSAISRLDLSNLYTSVNSSPNPEQINTGLLSC